jgi:hypothetical protein
MNDSDDSARFTIRDQDNPPDPIYMADADNLRLEKINARVTLISILIPCLLVVILAVAYLDIKHRVIRTQTSGSMGVQNLSKDLESRFSSLSLKQAKLEQAFAEFNATMETITASLQVNLKKNAADIKRVEDIKADRTVVKTITAQADKATATANELKKELADLNAAFDTFDDELSAQILRMAQGMKKDQGRLVENEKRIQRIDAEKLSKESMDLALGLERLALQEMVKDRLREMDKKLANLTRQIDGLAKRLDATSKKQAAQPVPVPRPVIQTPSPSMDQNVPSTNPILEQTIE